MQSAIRGIVKESGSIVRDREQRDKIDSLIRTHLQFRGGDPTGGGPRSDTGRSRLYRCVLSGVGSGRRLLGKMDRLRATRFSPRRCDFIAIVSLPTTFCAPREKVVLSSDLLRRILLSISSFSFLFNFSYLIQPPSILLAPGQRSKSSLDLFGAALGRVTCPAYPLSPRCCYLSAGGSRTVSESVD